MIDTIILSLPRTDIIDLDLKAQGVTPWSLHSKTNFYDKFVKNPSKKDKDTGKYYPRLTGYKRKSKGTEWVSSVRIEFSAPKLLYNNNLDELQEKDFKSVLNALHDRMKEMGVVIPKDKLAQASVTAVHYSQNIVLENSYTAQFVIAELGKINLNKRFDLTRTRFMNDGQSLYGYSVSNSFVFYDKVSDLKRGKRAIDKGQSEYQLSLFQEVKKSQKEILRFEVRLSQKRKMNSLFKKLEIKENPTFQEVFSEQISKAILNDYWQTMIENNSFILFGYSSNPNELLKKIKIARKKSKAKTLLYLTGLIQTAKDGSGMRSLRASLSGNITDRTWYRMVKDMKEISADLGKVDISDWFRQIQKALTVYQPFKIKKKLCNK